MKLPGMEPLFIFGNAEYKRENLKAQYKLSLRQKGTEEARRVNSFWSLNFIQHNEKQNKIKQNRLIQKQPVTHHHIFHLIYKPQQIDMFKNTEGTSGLVITIAWPHGFCIVT